MNLSLLSLCLRVCDTSYHGSNISPLTLFFCLILPTSLSLSLSLSVCLSPFTASNSTVSRPPAYISMAQLVAGQASQLFQGDAAYGNHGDVTMLNPHVLPFINLTLLQLGSYGFHDDHRCCQRSSKATLCGFYSLISEVFRWAGSFDFAFFLSPVSPSAFSLSNQPCLTMEWRQKCKEISIPSGLRSDF